MRKFIYNIFNWLNSVSASVSKTLGAMSFDTLMIGLFAVWAVFVHCFPWERYAHHLNDLPYPKQISFLLDPAFVSNDPWLDLIMSGTFWGMLFLLVISLYWAYQSSKAETLEEKFQVVSDSYLFSLKFMAFGSLMSAITWHMSCHYTNVEFLFNYLIVNTPARNIIVSCLLGPVFLDTFFMFYYQHLVSFSKLSRVQSLTVQWLLCMIFFFSCWFVRAYDLFAVYVLMEGMGLLLILVILLEFLPGSAQAAAKYFTYSAVAGGLFLFGLSILYGLTGFTDFLSLDGIFGDEGVLSDAGLTINDLWPAVAIMLVGFTIKLSVYPGHGWAPDVYSAVSYAAIFLISVFFKLVFVFVFMGILSLLSVYGQYLRFLILVISFASAIISFMGAYRQNNFKRWLAYSSINQFGFILLGLLSGESFAGVNMVIFYLISYIASTSLLFMILCLASNSRGEQITTMNDLSLFCRQNPIASIYITVALFSIAGLPPFIGFFPKYFILYNLFTPDLGSLIPMIFIILNAISVYYYLRIIRIIWTDSSSDALIDEEVWMLSRPDIAPDQAAADQKTLFIRFFLLLVLPLFLPWLCEFSTTITTNICPWAPPY